MQIRGPQHQGEAEDLLFCPESQRSLGREGWPTVRIGTIQRIKLMLIMLIISTGGLNLDLDLGLDLFPHPWSDISDIKYKYDGRSESSSLTTIRHA